MITTHGKYAVEVLMKIDDRGLPMYYAQSHCWCGSTFGSGDYHPSIAMAVSEAAEGMDDHQRSGRHAGEHFMATCVTCGTIAFVEPRDDGRCVCDRCFRREGGGL